MGAAGQVLIVHLLQDGSQTGANAPSVTSITNAEDLAGTDNVLTYIGAFNVGATPEAYQHLWIGRGLAAANAVITGANAGNDDIFVRIYRFDNVSTGTTLSTVIENATAGATVSAGATDGTIADASVQSLGADRLALNFVGINDDNAVAAFTGMTGGTWAEAVAEYADSGGTDGCIQLQTAAMASAGTIDGGTTTNSDATDGWGVVGFALIGTTVADLTPRNPAINHQNPGVL
jgi:hypothetical protein